MGRQKVWDFVGLKRSTMQQVQSYDKSYLSKIFCHYILMKIIFLNLYFHKAFMVGLLVVEISTLHIISFCFVKLYLQ